MTELYSVEGGLLDEIRDGTNGDEPIEASRDRLDRADDESDDGASDKRGSSGGGAAATGYGLGALDVTTQEVEMGESFLRDLERFRSDEFVRAALNQGVNLSEYKSEIDRELRNVELESVRDYVAQSEQVVELHQRLQQCDDVLARTQETLLGFQADLGGISDEIRHLQQQSLSMGVQLRNRRAAEARIGAFLERLVLPPGAARHLCDGDVSDVYLEYVVALNSRLSFAARDTPFHIHSAAGDGENAAKATAAAPDSADGAEDAGDGNDESENAAPQPPSATAAGNTNGGIVIKPRETRAGVEYTPQLESLRLRVVARVREHFLRTIAEMRRPKTNVAMIQQGALLKYAYLMTFLATAEPSVADEVRAAYVKAMGDTVHTLFKAYHTALAKLDLEVANKNDTIAVDESAIRLAFSTKVSMTKRGDVFALGERAAVLGAIDDAPIFVHIAQAEGAKYPFEVLFRSLMKHLMDAATSEWRFAHKFFGGFGADEANLAAASASGAGNGDDRRLASHETERIERLLRPTDAFEQVYAKAISATLESLENRLFNCHDIVGLLLVLRLLRAQRALMTARRVPALDGLFSRARRLLWPRVFAILETNHASVRSASPRKLSLAALSPHYVTRRYAELAASVLSLHPISNSGSAGSGPNGAGAPAARRASATLPAGAAAVGATPALPTAGSPTDVIDEEDERNGERLHTELGRLREAMMSLLVRLADTLPSNKERIVFLINNFDQALSVFGDRRSLSSAGGEGGAPVDLRDEAVHFEKRLAEQRELFVEEELLERYSRLIAFVQQTEAQSPAPAAGASIAAGRSGGGSGGADAPLQLDASVVEALVREFAATWKAGIEAINRDVLAFFSNFRNGMEILKQVLTQLLLYYTRFQDIVRRGWRRPPAFTKDIVSTAAILVEIKKYSRQF